MIKNIFVLSLQYNIGAYYLLSFRCLSRNNFYSSYTDNYLKELFQVFRYCIAYLAEIIKQFSKDLSIHNEVNAFVILISI